MGDREEHERAVRKIKQGKVEIDYEESSLVVHYDIETVTVAENGRVGEVLDRIPEVRRIKLKNLSADKNMAQLAGDIVEKCKYIHPSRVEEIEQLLIKLRKHALANPQPAAFEAVIDTGGKSDNKNSLSKEDHRDAAMKKVSSSSSSQPGRGGRYLGDDSRETGQSSAMAAREREREAMEQQQQPAKVIDEDELLPPANMDELDDYLELLYQV